MFPTNFAITSKWALKRLFYRHQVYFFVLSLFASTRLVAQRPLTAKHPTLYETHSWLNPFRSGKNAKFSGFALGLPNKLPQQALQSSILALPRFTPENLPVFCKIEHKMGKKMAVPLKFRLGSVDYVDWMEGKPGHFGY